MQVPAVLLLTEHGDGTVGEPDRLTDVSALVSHECGVPVDGPPGAHAAQPFGDVDEQLDAAGREEQVTALHQGPHVDRPQADVVVGALEPGGLDLVEGGAGGRGAVRGVAGLDVHRGQCRRGGRQHDPRLLAATPLDQRLENTDRAVQVAGLLQRFGEHQGRLSRRAAVELLEADGAQGAHCLSRVAVGQRQPGEVRLQSGMLTRRRPDLEQLVDRDAEPLGQPLRGLRRRRALAGLDQRDVARADAVAGESLLAEALGDPELPDARPNCAHR
jgi:hypothetical protein